MKIINRVEINYFRSIYSINLNKCSDVNVFLGENDVGKSNLLKSLNLFFNNETDLNENFEFIGDFSRTRSREAREVKGRGFIWIKVWFNNFLGWSSLPDSFYVKKSWNRYSQFPTMSLPNDMDPTLAGRFLNRLVFHYIPAVRSKGIYSHYLKELHDSLIESEKANFRKASDSLVDEVNKSTKEMSEKISNEIGIESSIRPPQDFRDLFGMLDFSTKFGEFEIPLPMRGDGIQGRHIPYILDFIAQNSSKYHIWAYEEPENSLEMGKAFDLAGQFESEFSKENQIFVTTHSPAFYSLSGDSVQKWHVFNSEFDSDGEADHEEKDWITEVKLSGDIKEADYFMGVAPLISERAKELKYEIEELRENNKRLSEKVESTERPQIVLEGKTDKKIFEIACEKIYGEDGFPAEFVSANGADPLLNFVISNKSIDREGKATIVGLFDNDWEGNRKFQKFSSYGFVPGTHFKTVSLKNRVFCGILPKGDIARRSEEKLRSNGFEGDISVPIEFVFPTSVVHRAVSDGIIELVPKVTDVSDGQFKQRIDLSDNMASFLENEESFFVYGISENCKVKFSDWVSDLDVSDFEPFREILEEIRRVLE